MATNNDKPGVRLAKSKTCQERFIKVNQTHKVLVLALAPFPGSISKDTGSGKRGLRLIHPLKSG